MLRYKEIQFALKNQILNQSLKAGDLLPSENELCDAYGVTRTTARKALEELSREGYIVRHQGLGSIVVERKETLQILETKGLSQAIKSGIEDKFITKPILVNQEEFKSFKALDLTNLTEPIVYFSRVRHINDKPVMLEDSWLNALEVSGLANMNFVDNSFFKTLSQKYGIDIIGSEQKLRAIAAPDKTSSILKIKKGAPILQINVKYLTSIPEYYIYSKLLCNTEDFAIGNLHINR